MNKNFFYLTSLWFLFIGLCLSIGHRAQAQSTDSFIGTFSNKEYGTTLTLKNVQGTYQGTLSTGYMNFKVTGKLAGDQLQGEVYHGQGRALPWRAWMKNGQLIVDAYGGEHPYEQVSKEVAAYNSWQTTLASEEAKRIAGSRLYWHREASIFATSGGAYGEIDLCPDGTFRDFSESSVMVEAGPENYNREYYDKMGSAGAASVSRSSGYWTVLTYQGVAYVGIQYSTGASYSTPLSQVMGGTWYVGKVKYAMDWGKGACR